MNETTLSIDLDPTRRISAVLSGPTAGMESRDTGIVVAHGAANDMHHPLIAAFTRGLSARGFWCLRFNFLYRENNRSSVDPEDRLIQAWCRAIETLKSETGKEKVIAAGKSLGARIAAQAAAEKAITPQGLIFLGYPLHAPGKKERLRDAPLYDITAPMLFFEGTRDPFCDLSLLNRVFSKMTAGRELMTIDNGDHGFTLPKTDPTPETAVWDRIIRIAAEWLLS